MILMIIRITKAIITIIVIISKNNKNIYIYILVYIINIAIINNIENG